MAKDIQERKDKKVKKEKKEKKEKKVENDSSSEAETEAKPELDEIEIDLNASVPLNKKQQRLLKKGKLDVDKLEKKNPKPKPATEDGKEEEAPKRSPFGVWIGNLSFDTTKEDLERFIVAKTSEMEPAVTAEDMSRINIPKKERKIKGFAYVDLPSQPHVESLVAISEQVLNGRKLLIKDSTSFEGRPEKSEAPLSKNPPSRILFVGNLSFDTTDDNLREHFQHCGEIVKIRMATFEDSGKCKGFAFVDFKDESGPTTALKSKLAKKFINRPLRLEYGEDRSKRTPKRRMEADENAGEAYDHEPVASVAPPVRAQPMQKKRKFDGHMGSNKRVMSSVALASAPRASAAIVESTGKKIKFA